MSPLKADEPHNSVRSRNNEIVSKGWFDCSVDLKSATLEVRLERRSGKDWEGLQRREKSVEPVKEGRKELQPVPAPCKPGTFRTSARLSAYDSAGEFSQSPWYYSKSRDISC